MNTEKVLKRALGGEFLTAAEGIAIFREVPLPALMEVAHEIRMSKHPVKEVSWLIDRNINITNVCVSQCKFCNFCRRPKSPDAYITTTEQYKEKIEELIALGGNQVLLQGGMHPALGLSFYIGLFMELKSSFPNLKLHALGPPEIVHIATLEDMTCEQVLNALIEAGLDSLPGAGAEILSDRVRKKISPAKCSAAEWLEVMKVAHRLGLTTSATMMFGHVETMEERIEHLIRIREVQHQKPEGATGFISFIPWPYQDAGTLLKEKFGISNSVSKQEYVKMIALSRIMLPNFDNIQASWLTVGVPTAQLCLHAGANDFGSVMIEENVVSTAGADYSLDIEQMQQAIKDAGFIPRQRNQQFEFLND
ncbi:MAG: cyclic dehypoxanthinyl futalosine synthase [Bacteroidota bacterium]